MIVRIKGCRGSDRLLPLLFLLERRGGIMATTPRGFDAMRMIVHKVCEHLLKHPGLIGAISAAYPTVGAALEALTAACSATGFDKVPEVHS